jgi:protein-S-isoprenylcysteine O-methyltransferase Ste14
MAILPLSPIRILLFFIFTLAFVMLSRKALRNPRCHGFYRFFVFEGVLFLALDSQPYWFIDIHAPRQIISWVILTTSLFFVLQGLYMLQRFGGSKSRGEAPENFAFENTTTLVTSGIYRYIRHPMYSSLLLLTWGAFFKHLSLLGLLVTILTTILTIILGHIEEKENLAFFGPDYLEYKKSSKMFLPLLF